MEYKRNCVYRDVGGNCKKKHTMKKQTYLRVLMDPFEDEGTLAEKLSIIKDVEFFQYDPEEKGIDIEGEKEWLVEVGITEAFYTQEYYEALGTTSHRPSDIKGIIQRYLDKILKTDQLLIIDRFIFPNNYDPSYPAFFVDVLDKYLSNLNFLKIITSFTHNVALKNSIIGLLKAKNPTLQIDIKCNDDFHDRFWISDFDNKGLFLGTSLNGFGRKYALIDYINTTDVRQIIAELGNKTLL